MSNTTKVLYALYVAIVLLVAGTAKADEIALLGTEQIPISISHVDVDHESLELLVAGHLPNPCYPNPSAHLTQDPENPNTLVLHLSSPLPINMCVTRIKEYNTVVSLPALVRSAQLNLEDKALYVIKTEGYEFELPIAGSELLR